MADIKKVIEDVMTKTHSMGELKSMNMSDGKKFNPTASYKIVYDSPQNQLEPIYYWILDFLNGPFQVKKITDNFMSSPGSGHFAEMGQRITKMQEEGMKILGGLNQVIKSSLNLIYDLKDFRQRLQHYEDANSSDPKIKESGLLSLKQIWLDSVDLQKRGRGSIHQMTAELGYTTLREAFMVANSLDDLEKMSDENEGVINESVARILKPRLQEFLHWKEISYKELKKRYNIEKSYLKSQIETIKLYSSWMKPYLKAANDLRQKGFEGDAALVNAFSTSMFELTLFCKKKASIPGKINHYKINRDYYACLVIDFTFRGHVMQRVNQKGDYVPAVGGRVEMNLKSYALNSEELHFVEKELEKKEIDEVLEFSSDVAKDALDELKEDLDEHLRDDKEEDKTEEKKNKNSENNINPFSALFGLFNSNKKKKSKKELNEFKDVKSDNWVEKQVRVDAINTAGSWLYRVYDIYKKSHGMASSPNEFDYGETDEPQTDLKEVFKKLD